LVVSKSAVRPPPTLRPWTAGPPPAFEDKSVALEPVVLVLKNTPASPVPVFPALRAIPGPFVLTVSALLLLPLFVMLNFPLGPVPVCVIAKSCVGEVVLPLWLMGSGIVPWAATPVDAVFMETDDACAVWPGVVGTC
jgi:hypothetical protein